MILGLVNMFVLGVGGCTYMVGDPLGVLWVHNNRDPGSRIPIGVLCSLGLVF